MPIDLPDVPADHNVQRIIDPAHLRKILSGLGYPAAKQAVLDHARENNGSSAEVDAISKMSDREYEGLLDITREVHMVMQAANRAL